MTEAPKYVLAARAHFVWRAGGLTLLLQAAHTFRKDIDLIVICLQCMTVYHGQVMGMFALANSSAGLPQRCVAERPNDPSSCIFSEHAYNSMESSIFVVDSTLDLPSKHRFILELTSVNFATI